MTSVVGIYDAITSGRAPAELGTLDLPGKVKVFLSACWERDPEARPTMESIDNALRLYIQTATSMPSLPKNTRERHADNFTSSLDYESLEKSLVRWTVDSPEGTDTETDPAETYTRGVKPPQYQGVANPSRHG